jgi:GH24 family phage-related lysozyme (muramidase)
MIQFHEITSATVYEDGRFSLISEAEGLRTAAYLDTSGIPSIGIGFNLRDATLQPLVFRAFGIDPSNPLLDATQQAREQLQSLPALQEGVTRLT